MTSLDTLLLSVRACNCMFPLDCGSCGPALKEAKQRLADDAAAAAEGAERVARRKVREKHADKLPHCRRCGCSDLFPCRVDGGGECAWLDETETICSQCASDEEE